MNRKTTGARLPMRSRCALVATFVGASLLYGIAAAAPDSPGDLSAAAEPADRLEEIVVTSRKTEEPLQRVPLSVVAITGDDLEKRSLDTLADVSTTTPNFTFSQQSQGGRSAGVIYIRGVGQADVLATYDPAVGVYIDGVYLGRMQGNDLGMMDIERVEVLRGPQGTLFGKNTSGGAINIVSKEPDPAPDALSGRAELTGGNFHRFDVVGSLNLPLVNDKVALLVEASRRTQEGYGERADGESTGSTNRDSGRISVLVKPSDEISALLSADGTHYNETNAVMRLVTVNSNLPAIIALNTFTPFKYDDRWVSPTPFFSYATGPNLSRGDLAGTSLTLTYDPGWVTLKSISAYRRNNVHNDLDPDVAPITIIDQFEQVNQDQFSQELQATGASFADRLNWVMGAYYFREAATDNADFNVLVPLFGNAAGFGQHNAVLNSSIAAYGQGTYKLTERLRLTAGIRFTHDEKEDDRTRPTFPGGLPIDPPTTKSASWNDASPRIGLDYQWTPNFMTYFSFAEGYKAGGFNGRADSIEDFNKYDPEKVRTYEFGLRSDLFERRVRFNATAFYNDYTDLQLEVNGTDTVNGVPGPFAIVDNIPKARVTGGELELDVIPTTGLTLSSGLGLTYGKYLQLPTDARFSGAQPITLESQFVNTPKLSATVGAEYTANLSRILSATGRMDYSYRSTIFYDPGNTDLLRQGGYGLLNARLTFEYLPQHISVSIFGTNLTDKLYIVGGLNDATVPNPNVGVGNVNMAPPRMYGASVKVKF
jgi:iron complex outermembrane recepter protein